MFKSKKANVLTALVLAIALWAYIFGSGATTTSKTFKDIPIQFENTEALTANGLVLLSKDAEKVSVTVSGLRTAVSATKPEDLKIVADVQYLPHGESNVMLVATAPEGLKIDDLSKQTLNIGIDNLANESKPIQVEIVNDTSDETEPYIVQLSREKTKVTGPETLVKLVTYCKAVLDATKVTTEMQAFSVELHPFDANGNEVAGVEITTPNVSITSVLLSKKTVNLVVPVVGEESERFVRTVEVPKAITVKGTTSELSIINQIECEPIDVSEIFESTTLALEPKLTGDVKLASDSEDLVANVTVQKALSKTFDLPSTDVSFTGITAKTKVNAPKIEVKAIVGGEQKVVNSLKETDFSISADLKGLGAGTHKVPLIIKSSVDVDMVKCEPSDITVTIE